MKLVKLTTFAMVASLAVAAPVLGQTRTPPKPQTPPSTAAAKTPAAQPAPNPQPSVPFPQDARYAIVDMQAVAQNSVTGKDASKKLNDLRLKEAADLQEKNKQLQALQTKRDTGGPVLSDAARAQLDKDIEKLQRDIQYAQSNAQAELNDLNTELMGDFNKKVGPVVQEIAKEKNLYIVFTTDAGIAYASAAVNITNEVVARLNAQKTEASPSGDDR